MSAPAHEPEPIVIPPGPERADVASPRRVEQPWMSLKEWRRRHEAGLHHPGRSEAKLVVLGDSIVEGWCESAAFKKHLGAYKPLNLGVGGDQTQHVLWRIEQGTLDGLEPGLVMVLIGVNNLGNGFSPDETLAGIRAVVDAVQHKLPTTPVLLLAILPAGQTSSDSLRQKIVSTDAQLAALATAGRVQVLDVGAGFVEPDGTISKTQMADFLHPTPLGQERLTAAVLPYVQAVLGTAP